MPRNLADEILVGAFDMHAHAYPEFSLEFPCRYTPKEHVAMMVEAGMGGVILKSHVWPCISLVEQLKIDFPGFNVISSITLNEGVGGMEPYVVEMAAKQGAKMAWLPTWSAHNDLERGGISKQIAKYVPTFQKYIDGGGLRLLDESGKAIEKVRNVLEIARDYDMVVSTGHISPIEALGVAEAAKDIGFKKLILCHPDSNSVKANLEQIKTFAEMGFYVELCALGLTPMHYRVTPAELGDVVRTVGAEHCVMSTDYFFAFDSASPELLRSLINVLLNVGITEGELRVIARQVPMELLNIE